MDTIELFKSAFAEKQPEKQPLAEKPKYGADTDAREALFSYAFGPAVHNAAATAAEAAKPDLDWKADPKAPVEVLARLQACYDAGTDFEGLGDLQEYARPDARAKAALRQKQKELGDVSIEADKLNQKARLAAMSKLEALAALAQEHPQLGSVQALYQLELADFRAKFGEPELPEPVSIECEGDTAADGVAAEAAMAVDADDAGDPAGADETAAGSDN